jgi:hypothetical protein
LLKVALNTISQKKTQTRSSKKYRKYSNKSKRAKRRTIIDKTPQEKINIEQHKPYWNGCAFRWASSCRPQGLGASENFFFKFYNRTNIYHNFFIAWYYFFWKSGSNEYKNADDNISLMSNQRILNLFIVYKIMIIIYEILTSNKLNRKNIFWFVFLTHLAPVVYRNLLTWMRSRFSTVCVVQYLFFPVVFCRLLFVFLLFLICCCIFCTFSNYGFWIHLRYFQISLCMIAILCYIYQCYFSWLIY